MGTAVVGEAGEGTAGEGVSEVEVGSEAAGDEVMVAGGRLRLLVNLSFYIERGVKRDKAPRFGIYYSRYPPWVQCVT